MQHFHPLNLAFSADLVDADHSLLIVHLHGEGGARLTLQFREELS
jgi:hypothetical protein